MMNKTIFKFLWLFLVACLPLGALMAQDYVPTEANLKNRQDFEDDRFGIFLHWGIYSMYAQGEWYLNTGGLNNEEYSQAAHGFYPSRFDAKAWVKAFKDAGARYICITSRHHDGFSMFKTAASNYNIVDGTPFGRDVLAELSQACKEEGIKFHVYYSLLDWIREDYPIGNTGHKTGRKGDHPDYNSYFNFMKGQIREILTNYGDVRALWFDGYWDHPDGKSATFDWRMRELYDYIHSIKPACLVGNNHHIATIPGEDFQMFERDLPGENKAGLSSESVIGRLPLEMCQTMNGMWGYKVADLNYKSVKDLIHLLVRCASKGSNMLMNIGPRADGTLPDLSLDRLKGMGQWLRQYGESVYGTGASIVPEQKWGVSTQNDKSVYLHVFSCDSTAINVPITQKIKSVTALQNVTPLKYKTRKGEGIVIDMPKLEDEIDYIIKVELK